MEERPEEQPEQGDLAEDKESTEEEEQTSEEQALEEGEPSRPQFTLQVNTGSPDRNSPSKPRRAGTAQTARFQSVSSTTAATKVHREIPDSYEEVSNRISRFQVVIPPLGENFQSSSYSKVTITSSQASQVCIINNLSHLLLTSTSLYHLHVVTY